MKTDWADYIEEREAARSLLKLCIDNMRASCPPKGGYTDKLIKACRKHLREARKQ